MFCWNILSLNKKYTNSLKNYEYNHTLSTKRISKIIAIISNVMKENKIICLYEVDYIYNELVTISNYYNYTISEKIYDDRFNTHILVPNNKYKSYKFEYYPYDMIMDNADYTGIGEKTKDLLFKIKKYIVVAKLDDINVAATHLPCIYQDAEQISMGLLYLKNVIKIINKYDNIIWSMDGNLLINSELYKTLCLEFISVYKLIKGNEPMFTCWTDTAFGGKFKDTIDYIWIKKSSNIQINDITIPYVDSKIPNKTIPSDHIWFKVEF